jgi:hypothetical protein
MRCASTDIARRVSRVNRAEGAMTWCVSDPGFGCFRRDLKRKSDARTGKFEV